MPAKIPRELEQQLARAGKGPVQAVFHLRAPDQPEQVCTPEATVKLANEVLKRVTSEVGRPAARTNVLRNLETLIVEADSDFLRTLSQQPEVVAALPNQTAASPFIPPVKKGPIKKGKY